MRNWKVLFLKVILCGFILLIPFIEAVPIDNGVVGSPQIGCGPDSTRLDFVVRNEFHGHVFAKGYSNRQDCRQDYTSNRIRTLNGSLIVPFSTCGSSRTRSTNPRGVFVTSTIIVQFHPQFITKVDRAYRIRCFYMETDKTVDSELDVSMLTTIRVDDVAQMPICTYSIRRTSIRGPEARYFQIGEKVWHVWECVQPDSESGESAFGMLVHSCYVHNGRDNDRVMLVDENGCSMDPYILGHLQYGPNLLSAHREAHVFKFADRTELMFQCQIRLCQKAMDTCQGMTPPRCAQLKNRRKRRDATHLTESVLDVRLKDRRAQSDGVIEDFDVETPQLVILDPREEIVGIDELLPAGVTDPTSNGNGLPVTSSKEHLCFDRPSLSTAFIVMSMLLLACTITCTMLMYQRIKQARQGKFVMHEKSNSIAGFEIKW